MITPAESASGAFPPPSVPLSRTPASGSLTGSVARLAELAQRYSIAAPRYTSYPPATQFQPDSDPAALAADLAADSGPGATAPPLSLYFHLPFCTSLCWYCGCHTIITGDTTLADAYVRDLATELRLTAVHLTPGRPVTQVHLGGGTPTFLSPAALRTLGRAIDQHFTRTPDCEFSVEIDPRRATADHFDALRAMGANRASLGIQDTDRRVQLAIHRFQPPEKNLAAVTGLRAAGFTSINFDLIYGLPHQTPESFARTLDEVLALGPDRLSVFSYAHVPWLKPAQRIFEDREQLPPPEAKLAMWTLAHAKLIAAGFIDIGLDHFARPDDELARALADGTLHRNFQGYSTRAGASLAGFGISSISQTATTYRQNFKSLADWSARLAAGRLPVERSYRLTAEDQQRRTLIMSLMCQRRLDFPALSAAFGCDVAAQYAPELARLAPLVADGLVTIDAQGVRVTDCGAPFLRVVAMQFDATLPRPGTAPVRRHAASV